MDYGIDKGRERVVSTPGFRDPWYGGWYGRGFYRPVIVRGRHGRRYVTGWYDPFMLGGFGGGGDKQVSSYTFYPSNLNLSIHPPATRPRFLDTSARGQARP